MTKTNNDQWRNSGVSVWRRVRPGSWVHMNHHHVGRVVHLLDYPQHSLGRPDSHYHLQVSPQHRQGRLDHPRHHLGSCSLASARSGRLGTPPPWPDCAVTRGSGGWLGVTRDLDDLPDLGSLQHLVRSHNIVAVVGLHAYRTAHVLSACKEVGVPYVVVFGGTDMNECAKEATKLEVMRRVVGGARHLVVFDSIMRDLVLATWPTLDPGVMSTLPQAVLVDPSPDVDVSAYLKTLDNDHEKHRPLYNDQMSELSQNVDSKVTITNVSVKENYIHPSKDRTSVKENDAPRENVYCCEVLPGGLKQNNKSTETLQKGKSITPLQEMSSPESIHDLPEIFQPLVLLVAGLRPVKDVLYVAEAWSTWHRTHGGRGRLVILGPTLDPDYAAHVHAQAARMSGVRVAASLPPRECQAVMRSATVLVNSSLSESMPSSLLEAMLLGTPVLARDIPGNASLVAHGETGLVFSSPATFLQGLDALLHQPHLRASLVAAAEDRVRRHHSLERERDNFLRILQGLVERVEPAGP
ncbi:glycosyltransferase 1 domain-containing protein 1-like [Panulirus ornatus]|uniref:glycosyltransferase 1 domain-containing protein 1-like n=1 Tax=Panulirus ornatus TaxID=150431 RepID=UPI003A8B0160